MSVVDFAEHKFRNQPHNQGPIRCMECGHEWVAVRPAATEPWWFECPSCQLEKGRPVGPFEKESSHWVCNCGNDLFFITPNGPYCPHCGIWFEAKD
jgi:hypothetical protein